MVPIYGLQKTTLLDYKGYIASTIFLGHCNYRCPFCQNSLLIGATILEPSISEEEIFTHLARRKGLIEGVCITGGEPTLYEELPAFLAKIKALGYKIKLDTNGTNPQMLSALIKENLIDYVAMDIKNSLSAYSISCGIPDVKLAPIKESVSLLKDGPVPYEFRTTLVKEHHTKERLMEIGTWLSGPSDYILQNYQDSDHILKPGLHGFTEDELKSFKELLLPLLPNTHIRGEVY